MYTRLLVYTEHVMKFETMYLYFIKCFFVVWFRGVRICIKRLIIDTVEL